MTKNDSKTTGNHNITIQDTDNSNIHIGDRIYKGLPNWATVTISLAVLATFAFIFWLVISKPDSQNQPITENPKTEILEEKTESKLQPAENQEVEKEKIEQKEPKHNKLETQPKTKSCILNFADDNREVIKNLIFRIEGQDQIYKTDSLGKVKVKLPIEAIEIRVVSEKYKDKNVHLGEKINRPITLYPKN